MKALDRKLLNDLWHLRGQVLAIAVVLAAASAIYVLSAGTHASLTRARDVYYAQNGFADVFAEMTRAPADIVERAAVIPGVARAEGGIRQLAMIDMPGTDAPMRAVVNSIDDRRTRRINRITLKSGRLPLPDAADEIVADEAFAEANALGPGDRIAAVIYGKRQDLRIVGIGLAPDHIFSIAPGDLVPDNSRFGVLWMGQRALEAATDRVGGINTLVLILAPDAVPGEVIRQLDHLLEPYGGTGAYAREDQISHALLDSELKQLDALTRVIPPVFLLVATFLVLVVLGRLIRTERGQIGLMKAFGYANAAVGWHYAKFALVIAVLASVIGCGAGVWMGHAMTDLYARYYRFPVLEFLLDPAVFLIAVVLALGASLLGALVGARSAVGITPAQALAPPPPPIYHDGPLERLAVRARLSPGGLMIIRHIARWPARAAMTTSGVALSLGLLFATIQFHDSSSHMIRTFFIRAQAQDLTVTFTHPRNEAALHELAKLPGVIRVEAVRAVPVRLSHANRTERAAIESADNDSRLSARIDRDGAHLALPPAGLMLSRQLADQLGVTTGAAISVEVLDGKRTRGNYRVASVVDEFIGARAYADAQTLMQITREALPASGALLRIDQNRRAELLARLDEMPGVLGVSERSAALALFEAMIDDNLYTMLFVFVGFASAIVVGVVYNSARILLSERAHELATLRVLGYHRSEVAAILVGELALLVVLAIPLGCLAGVGLGRLMTAMFSSDLFRIPFAPERATYGLSIIVVLAAAAITCALVARRVLALDLVRVLKARE